MPRSAEDWLLVLLQRDPRLDRTLLRVIAGVLARDDLLPDVHLILADALDEAAQECVAGGRAIDALPLRAVRNIVSRAAEQAPRIGAFW
jgi:hypothetical protein